MGHYRAATPSTADSSTSQPAIVRDIPADRYELRVLSAVRRIIRATDLHSKRLAARHGITVPQLVCLTKVVDSDGITVKDLAEEIYLSASTVVGILDRLEARGLLIRERSKADKRMVHIRATRSGRELVATSPSPLHEELANGLRAIPDTDQLEIAQSLEKLVELLELEQVDAAPILETDPDLEDGAHAKIRRSC